MITKISLHGGDHGDDIDVSLAQTGDEEVLSLQYGDDGFSVMLDAMQLTDILNYVFDRSDHFKGAISGWARGRDDF